MLVQPQSCQNARFAFAHNEMRQCTDSTPEQVPDILKVRLESTSTHCLRDKIRQRHNVQIDNIRVSLSKFRIRFRAIPILSNCTG